MAAGDRRGYGSLQSHVRMRERGKNFVGEELAGGPFGADAGLHTIPINLDSGRIDCRYRRVCDLRTDSITGNKRYLMGHDSL